MKKIDVAILLAGGEGTRLRPFTHYTSKHLLPVFDKPMIYYPLSNLILLGVKKVCIVINPKHYEQWSQLLNSIEIEIEIVLILQNKPEGIPQGITLCEEHIKGKGFYLSLGDNLLLGSGLLNRFKKKIIEGKEQCVIVGYPVKDPTKFGIAEFDTDKGGQKKLKKILEKPKQSISNMAIVGLYYFSPGAFNVAKTLKKSSRGEYEIADLINHYIMKEMCELMKCNLATDFWLDTGTPEALVSASIFLREINASGQKNIGNLGKLP